MGEPLVSPTGLHVDDDGVAWVMDHRAAGAQGEGVLFAIPRTAAPRPKSSAISRMGTPGGVSLTAGGGIAVMPTHRRRRSRSAHLRRHRRAARRTQLAAPDIIDPAGLRTAREAGVFAVVDSEGGAIYRAE